MNSKNQGLSTIGTTATTACRPQPSPSTSWTTSWLGTCADTNEPRPQGRNSRYISSRVSVAFAVPSDALKCEFAVFLLATKSRICASLQSNSCAVMDPRNSS